MANVYSIKITYRGCADKIWRALQISSNAPLSQLGYAVLATFMAKGEHLFEILVGKMAYQLPFETSSKVNLCSVKLSQLDLAVGDKLRMIYDYGCDQTFDMEVTGVAPMPKSSGRAYPKVTAGEGRGIVENMAADELLQVIQDTDRTGNSPLVLESEVFGE